jgi:hypothetical protein
VERTSGQAELVDEFRKFATDQRAFTRELTGAVKDLSMAMAAKGMFSTNRAAGSSLTAEARRMLTTDVGLLVPESVGSRGGSIPDSQATSARAKGRVRGGDAMGFGGSFAPLAHDDGQPEPLLTPAFDRVPRPEPHAPAMAIPKNPFQLAPTFRDARSQGLRGVRQAFFSHATSLANNLGGNNAFEQVTVPEHMKIGERLAETPINIPKGTATKQIWRNMKTFDVVEEGEAAAGIRAGLRGAALKEGLASMASGGSLSEGIATGLPALGKTLGTAGLIIGAADQAQKFFAGQVEANRPFQQVLGGSNSEGYNERVRQNLFRLKNRFSFNPISGRDSEAIYQGAMELYAGDKTMRNLAQGQMTDILRSTGQSPEKTLALFKTAARAGTESLSQIGASLKDVTKAAREAGMNAQEARDKFGQAYADISKSMGGAGGILLASAQAQAITQAGHQFGGVTFDNGITQDIFTTMQTGKGLGTIAADKMSGGTQQTAASADKRRRDAVTSLFQNQIQDIMKARGISLAPGEKISPEKQRIVAEELARQNPNLDPTIVAQGLSQLGGIQGLDRNNAYLGAVKAATGGFDTSQAVQESIAKFTDPSKRQGNDLDPKSTDGAIKFMMQVLGLSKTEAVTLVSHIDDAEQYVKSGSVSGKKAAALLYMKKLRDGAQRSTITEGLITRYKSDRRYSVTSAGGQEHIVGTNELITDFMDQAQSGKVGITKGDGQGSSVANLFGLSESDLPGYNEEQESASKDYKGKNFDKQKNENPSGTIIVKAAPELARWIQLQGTDGTVVRTEGYPNSGNVTPSQRPTGGG